MCGSRRSRSSCCCWVAGDLGLGFGCVMSCPFLVLAVIIFFLLLPRSLWIMN